MIARAALGLSAISLVALGVQLSRDDGRPLEMVEDEPEWAEGRVRVEVMNAGDVSGMARAATFDLRDAGFDVVDFGNADDWDPERPELESIVVDRVGRGDMAEAVAAALGIDNVQSEPDPNLFVDVTVVLGRNWVGPAAGERSGETGPERARWDPRGWIGR